MTTVTMSRHFTAKKTAVKHRPDMEWDTIASHRTQQVSSDGLLAIVRDRSSFCILGKLDR